MIELLAAVFVIALALVSALGLATSNLKNQAVGAARLTASNLAREGIELARNIRDTNWLSDLPGDKWNFGLKDSNGTVHCAIIVSEAAQISFSFRQCPNTENNQLDYYDAAYRLFRGNDGGYFQAAQVPVGSEATLFYRTMRLDPVCLATKDGQPINEVLESPDGQCPVVDNTPTTIGVRVTSIVAWKQGGGAHSVVLAQDLMNWR